jgi:predicted nucleic acid-binding protein
MILLDTNVLSALMRYPIVDEVSLWLESKKTHELWTTAINVFEVRAGLSRMPEGRRRRSLEDAFDILLIQELNGRIAPLDGLAADSAGKLAAARFNLGRPVDIRDTLIAGISLARNAMIATRNVKHFSDFDLRVENPWEAV